MADHLTKDQRRKNMRAVKNKDSQIELILRRALWNEGLRYRKHYSEIPGKPDIVFVSKKLAIFCDSEFWHGKNWKEKKLAFKSNKKFWINKIESNIARDKEVNDLLSNMGWKVLRFWGSQIKNETENCVEIIKKELSKR